MEYKLVLRISNEIYQKIINGCPEVPPETGGFIGIKDDIVCRVDFDNGIARDNLGTYYPDAVNLNKIIKIWQVDGVEEYGIFHTHRPNQIDLSEGDKTFIQNLMNANPTVRKLYFPIVIPKKEICFYDAVRERHKVKISTVFFKIN